MNNPILTRGDCLEVMKEIASESVDLILCDLPYGTTRNKWDVTIPLESLWTEYRRIAKQNAAICLFGQMPFSADLVNSNRKMFRYEWIWRKSVPTGFLNANRMPMKIHEQILVFYRSLPTYNPQKTEGKPYVSRNKAPSTNYNAFNTHWETINKGDRYPVDILKFNRESKLYHSTQKPVALLEYLIRTYSNEGDVVLDNCMGSGSTGVAAVNTGRRFIGIELDPDYFKIAEDRIFDAIANRGALG